MRRGSHFDEDFSRDMEHLDARQAFILELMNMKNDPMELEEALKFTVERMGTLEFAKLVGEQKQNVDKFIKGHRKLKRETLDKYLKPFGLKTVLSVVKVKKKRVA